MTNYEMFLAAAFVALIIYTVGVFCVAVAVFYQYSELDNIYWKETAKLLFVWTIFNFFLTGLIYLIIFTAVRSGMGG